MACLRFEADIQLRSYCVMYDYGGTLWDGRTDRQRVDDYSIHVYGNGDVDGRER